LPRERGLAGPRRAPQDHRRELSRLDRLAEHAAFADDVLLADEFAEIARAHPRGERLRGGHASIVLLSAATLQLLLI